MEGEYDDELTWPLKGNFQIRLLNQISEFEHLSCTVTYDDNTYHKKAARVACADEEKLYYLHGT